jgi:glucan phosphoethanolaminetransferase (alkaline phosphatase superfamily)
MILGLQSLFYAVFATLQIAILCAAIASLRYRIPLLHRIAAPASALLVLNAAAICAFYKFLFTRGPLFEIWNRNQPESTSPSLDTAHLVPRKPPVTAAVPLSAPAIGITKTLSTDSHP